MTKNIFLFTGEESYQLHEQVKSWKAAFIAKHGDINLETLDAKEIPLPEIMASMLAMPFLGDKRLIFVYGLPDEPSKRETKEPTKKDEKRNDDLSRFEEALSDIPDSTVAVFVQGHPDKRKSFYKKLVKRAEVKTFEVLSGHMLNTWIQKEMGKRGATISVSSAEYLASLVGQNLWRVSQELGKLATYSQGAKIDRAMIDQLVVPTMEANIFQLTDALGVKDYKKAIFNLHRSMAAGENLRPVFYMIVRQFRLLIQGSGYKSNNPNANSTAFAAALKLHPFVARNTMGQLKNFKQGELKLAYNKLLNIDLGLKTSKIRVTTDNQDELALAIERFILSFCC